MSPNQTRCKSVLGTIGSSDLHKEEERRYMGGREEAGGMWKIHLAEENVWIICSSSL